MLKVGMPQRSGDAPSPKSLNGMEGMLRAMGLSAVLDAAQQLAEAGTVQKIMKFADEVEGVNERLGRIEAGLQTVLERQRQLETLFRGAEPATDLDERGTNGADHRDAGDEQALSVVRNDLGKREGFGEGAGPDGDVYAWRDVEHRDAEPRSDPADGGPIEPAGLGEPLERTD